MFEVNIYIETSLKGPGTRKGWYAAVVEYIGKNKKPVTREDFCEEEETTFHRSALRALIKSLKRLNTSCNLTIHTDNIHLVSSFDHHLSTWEENGFINAKNQPIRNQEEWKEVSRLLKGHKVLFVYEKNHKYTQHMMELAKNHSGEVTEKV